jgi:hypothetical protein
MTDAELKSLVSEGAKLSAELAALKPKEERLDEIKLALRAEANGVDSTFEGEHGEMAEVTHARDGIARSIRGELLNRVFRLAGGNVWNFFQLAPIPAKELPQKDLRVEILSTLPKRQATALLGAITVPSTPRVKFA